MLKLARKKALELEDFNAPEVDESGRLKRRRLAGEEDGSKIVEEFLRAFKALPLAELGEAEAMEQIKRLCLGLDDHAASNPWLKELTAMVRAPRSALILTSSLCLSNRICEAP